MNEPLSLILAMIAGMLLGALFFGGLWWTVRHGIAAEHPEHWFAGSLLLRMGITMLGFYFILGNDWRRLLAGMLGFVAARLLVMQLTRAPDQTSELAPETGHAP